MDLDPEPCNTTLQDLAETIIKVTKWGAGAGYTMTAAPYKDAKTWGRIAAATRHSDTGRQLFANFNCQLYGNYAIMEEMTYSLAEHDDFAGVEHVGSFLWGGWAPCEGSTWNLPAGADCAYVAGRSAEALRAAVASTLHRGAGGAFLWNSAQFGNEKMACSATLKEMRSAISAAARAPAVLDPSTCPNITPLTFGMPFTIRCPGSVARWLRHDANFGKLSCRRGEVQAAPLMVFPTADRPFNPDEANQKLHDYNVTVFSRSPREGQSLLLAMEAPNGYYYFAGLDTASGELVLPTSQEGKSDPNFHRTSFELYASTTPGSDAFSIRMRAEKEASRPWCVVRNDEGSETIACSSESSSSTFEVHPVLHTATREARDNADSRIKLQVPDGALHTES